MNIQVPFNCKIMSSLENIYHVSMGEHFVMYIMALLCNEISLIEHRA